MNERGCHGRRLTRMGIMRLRQIVRTAWLVVVVSASVAWVLAAPIMAQGASKPTASTAVERGKETFQQSCAVCHGDRGNGKGPAAPALTPRPADLTMLARQKGAFPAAQVTAALKGTDPVVAHGNPGMMIWGAMFLAEANGDQAKADARISDVVKFIESIQVK